MTDLTFAYELAKPTCLTATRISHNIPAWTSQRIIEIAHIYLACLAAREVALHA